MWLGVGYRLVGLIMTHCVQKSICDSSLKEQKGECLGMLLGR